jgi:pilus assembly protein CpaF
MAEATLKDRVRRRLVEEHEPGLFTGAPADRRLKIREAVRRVLEQDRVVIAGVELATLVRELSDEVVGLGPLEELLRDPQVTEVMINGPDRIYIEFAGRIQRAGVKLESDAQIYHLIERVIGPLGLRVDESQPFVEARLPDGSRMHAIIPPLSIEGPAVTIRKFSAVPFTFETLRLNGTLTGPMVEFLDGAVRAKMNIVISGGTGSGKTTLLNVLSSSIPEAERLITIEEAAELRLGREHVVALEARPPNMEGVGRVTVRDLVRNALRMRPDRIIVGECRSGEALDMLQAMNTGHEGSLSTCHANSPEDLLGRLASMVMMAELGLAPGPVRQQIGAALDLIVHTTRFQDGTRKVVKITEIQGLDDAGLKLSDVFVFEPSGVSSEGEVMGEHRAVQAPACLSRFAAAGVPTPGLSRVWAS